MKKAISMHIFGTLRKRGFRFYSMQKAVELGIAGTVSYTENRNEIVIHAEGEEDAIEKFKGWCAIGSPSCVIQRIETALASPGNYHSFDIIDKKENAKKKSLSRI